MDVGTFSPTPLPSSGAGGGAGERLNNRPRLHGEAAVTFSKRQGSESFPGSKHIPVLGWPHGRDRAILLGILLDLFLRAPCNILYNTTSQCVCLSSASSYSKLSNLRRGLWETSICSQVRQKEVWVTWRPITCNWHLKWWVVLWD